jgi:hypothetical protein
MIVTMDALDNGFETFSKCAYRLEVLPQYSIYDTNEFFEYEKFIKGEVINGFVNQEWLESITQWKNSGKTIERVRVIPQVLTDYFKYEFIWCYPKNIEHGENIRFISYDKFVSICGENLLNDFWAFDQENVVLLLYNDKFEYDNCKQLSQDEVNSHLKIFEKLQAKTIDYEQCKNNLLWK